MSGAPDQTSPSSPSPPSRTRSTASISRSPDKLVPSGKRPYRRDPGDGGVFEQRNARSVEAAKGDDRKFRAPRQTAESQQPQRLGAGMAGRGEDRREEGGIGAEAGGANQPQTVVGRHGQALPPPDRGGGTGCQP